MVARVAMHVVRRATKLGKLASVDGKTPAVAPEYEEIQPGTLFDVKDTELAALEAAGAVVSPTDKRAAKFGYGTEAGLTAVQQEEGETVESAAQRRKAASELKRTPTAEKARLAGTKANAKVDPLLAGKDTDLVG